MPLLVRMVMEALVPLRYGRTMWRIRSDVRMMGDRRELSDGGITSSLVNCGYTTPFSICLSLEESVRRGFALS